MPGHGSLNPPLYLSSTYTFPTVEDGSARFAGEQAGFVYSRVGNPTTALLEARLADLEGGEAALVTASGQGATTSLLWTLLRAGRRDHRRQDALRLHLRLSQPRPGEVRREGHPRRHDRSDQS